MINLIKSLLIQLLVFLIKTYKYIISPLLPRACRYMPTCSEYSIEALKKHGLFIGLWLSIRRFIYCNTWGGHGFDPVP